MSAEIPDPYPTSAILGDLLPDNFEPEPDASAPHEPPPPERAAPDEATPSELKDEAAVAVNGLRAAEPVVEAPRDD